MDVSACSKRLPVGPDPVGRLLRAGACRKWVSYFVVVPKLKLDL